MTAKKTPLYSAHQALNAQFVEFASTLLPVRFHSEKEEHLAVRQAVGIFDVSHMGEFFVSGKNAASFLDHLLTNNVNRLSENEAQYSLLLNEQGGIIDDLIIYRQRNGQFLLCVNAANIERDWQHISREKRSVGDVEIENASHRFAQIAVQGKKASELLRLLTKSQLPARFHIVSTKLNSIETLVARTGYTGEDGFEIFLSNVDAEHLWQILLEHGQALGIKPCGLAARDSLRLEAGLLLHGQDMDETTTPIEAGLMFAVDMNKKNFIGKDALIKQKARGISK
ncbi:MAG TPA: glycine cleavage system aminomethyltransferase GcvT, partial [Myxococcota bacterium]|nr:glycine cleavage system aminomethyltransferase GcvT [Myxococcota bacterium]